MTSKEFTYRGKTLEELKKLDVREFAKLVKSRERRTIFRQFNEIEKFVNRAKIKSSKKKLIKTHDRDLVIVPQMVGMKIATHNGKTFVPIEIVGEMVGHRLGEFSLTRKFTRHGGKMQRELEAAKATTPAPAAPAKK